MDGVLYRGDRPIEGAADAIARLRERGVRIVFCTNNSYPSLDQYVARLRGFGIDAEPSDIVTSAVVTASVLRARSMSGTTAVVVGGDGIREALVGIDVAIDNETTTADLVVVGWDPTFTYAAMRRAAIAIRGGAWFVAANGDATFPAPGPEPGTVELWPGTGAILASIETASGGRAEIMGKPHDPMMDEVAARLTGAEHIAIVGDRPDTDLEGGRRRGWMTILVLTGVTSPEEATLLDPQPDLTLESIAELA